MGSLAPRVLSTIRRVVGGLGPRVERASLVSVQRARHGTRVSIFRILRRHVRLSTSMANEFLGFWWGVVVWY